MLNVVMKHITLLLYIGLTWGQSLKFLKDDGQSVIINPSGYDLKGDLLYLNGTKFFLNDIDYEAKTVKVKKVYRTAIGRLINYNKYEYIPFDSIDSFRFLKRQFSIVPMLIGVGIGVSFSSKGDTPSLYFGTILAFISGIFLSFMPQFSEELIVSDDKWFIVIPYNANR
tara:strand:- start:1 stop:507 length:507 start_codon:yes stop_codon:yes gene_type:complete